MFGRRENLMRKIVKGISVDVRAILSGLKWEGWREEEELKLELLFYI